MSSRCLIPTSCDALQDPRSGKGPKMEAIDEFINLFHVSILPWYFDILMSIWCWVSRYFESCKFTICMQAAAANGAFPYPGLFPPLGQFAPFPRPPLFPPILPPSPPSPGSIRKQELPPHLGGRPLLPLIPPPQCSTSPPSLRSPTSELRDSIFQSQNHLRAIAGQELDNEQDSKVRAVS